MQLMMCLCKERKRKEIERECLENGECGAKVLSLFMSLFVWSRSRRELFFAGMARCAVKPTRKLSANRLNYLAIIIFPSKLSLRTSLENTRAS